MIPGTRIQITGSGAEAAAFIADAYELFSVPPELQVRVGMVGTLLAITGGWGKVQLDGHPKPLKLPMGWLQEAPISPPRRDEQNT